MDEQNKFRILGAFVIGVAIVGGAYTLSNFNQSRFNKTQPIKNSEMALVTKAPARIAISTKDSNDDGVEDWREEFVTGKSLKINTSSTTYKIPDTVTAQLGIDLMQDVVRAKGFEGFSRSTDDILESHIKDITKYGQDTILDIRNITIIENNSPEEIRDYANKAASIILDKNNPDLGNEINLLGEALRNNDQEAIEKITSLARIYKNTIEETLKLKVPSNLTKEHLDLLNVYNALYNDLNGMSQALNDPTLSLVRLKRYKEDAEGLLIALQNMFLAIEPYAKVFKKDDPALILVSFSPNFQ